MIGSSDDNPFVIAPKNRTPVRSWLRAATVLIVCVFGVYGLHALTQRWLISRLADNLEAHSPHVQMERLGMLAEFGEPGLPKIVAALASADNTVSTTAFRILTDLQGRWQTTLSEDVVRCQHTLLHSIEEIADACPPERRPRIAELLNQTVLDTVGASNEEQAEIYRRACDLLAVVTASEANGSPAAKRVAIRPAVSLSEVDAREGAMSRRPLLLAPLPTASAVRIITADSSIREPVREVAEGPDGSAAATEDREPQPIDSSRQPKLAPISRSSFIETPLPAEETMLGDNPLAAYDTRSVIDFIGSVQPTLREAAEQELRKRDFNDSDMELAARLTSPSAKVRLAMVAELPSRGDVDPRRWLIWLAHDAERDVRLQAISRLGTMDDPEVRKALRERLQVERDPTVATRLRRFLGLR